MSEIEIYKLDAAFASLKQFDPIAKDNDFIEVCLWKNDEGFDVHLSSSSEQNFQLTWNEFKAIKKLVKKLNEMP